MHLLWNAYVGSTKKKVREQERAQRLEKLRSERDNSDAVSIITYSTTPSVVTAVNSEVPAAIKTPGNADGKHIMPPAPYARFVNAFAERRFITRFEAGTSVFWLGRPSYCAGNYTSKVVFQ